MTSRTQLRSEFGEDDLHIEEYLRDAELQGLIEETLRLYNSNLQTFFDEVGRHALSIDRRDLRDFLHHPKNERTAMDGSIGVAHSTINSYFSALNSYYKFLKFEGYIEENIVPGLRDRYLDMRRGNDGGERQLISIEEMAMLVHGTLNVRDRAVIVLIAKTGVSRNELIQIDVDHINWEEQSIQLRPTAKRTNELVFFDGECYRVLERWLRARDEEYLTTDVLFTNQYGERLQRNGVYQAVTKHAESVGLHDPDSSDPPDRFTPHCCRHWFTTHLRRAGMKREFIQELRGDTWGDAIDIYDHIDKVELRESFIAHIPTLGI